LKWLGKMDGVGTLIKEGVGALFLRIGAISAE
jgi:hypothetical protein